MTLPVRSSRWLLLVIGMACSTGAAIAAGAHTGNQFAVTEAGVATLTVPIQVPRGIAGMEPQLSLNYSSGAGNGLLGLGWTLSGPSAVTRCPKTLVHDNERGAVTFGVGDRFCLDGQRLVLVTGSSYGADGSEYRTERDGFSRITASGGTPAAPSSFKVETKAGLILEFGISPNSQVLTNFGSGMGANTINRWMLQRISDRHQNYVEFVYCGGEVAADGSACNEAAWAGSKVLHYIRYTNRGATLNGTSAVLFGYETRPDRVTKFHYGSSSLQTQRMTTIDTYVGFTGPSGSARGQRIRRYTLTYAPLVNAQNQSVRTTNASRLISVQESDGAATPTSLPALALTYGVDAVFGMFLPQSQASQPALPPQPSCGGSSRTTAMCP